MVRDHAEFTGSCETITACPSWSSVVRVILDPCWPRHMLAAGMETPPAWTTCPADRTRILRRHPAFYAGAHSYVTTTLCVLPIFRVATHMCAPRCYCARSSLPSPVALLHSLFCLHSPVCDSLRTNSAKLAVLAASSSTHRLLAHCQANRKLSSIYSTM